MMPTRRRSRADQRKPNDTDINTPFLDRRSEKIHDVDISVIERGSNLGIILKREIVSDNLLPVRDVIRLHGGRDVIKRIVINLEAVPYIDTAAVGMLTETQRMIKAAGKELILVNLHPRVARFFDILNLYSLFDVRRLT